MTRVPRGTADSGSRGDLSGRGHETGREVGSGEAGGCAAPAIRAATTGDAAAVTACVERAYRHYVGRIGRRPGPMLDDYRAVLDAHQGYVVEIDGRVAGVLVLVAVAGGIVLDNVAVHPDFQGRGIGRRLVAFAEARAREQGHDALDLYTHARMTENLELYARLGYVVTERRTERGFARVYMRKTLVRRP